MKRIILLLCFPLSTVSLLGQEDTIYLEDITVSVTPFSQRLSESTGSLSILPAEQSLQANTINIAELINTAPGVNMSAGTHSTNRITIRGIGSRTPYGSNRIRAYLDEIPLTGGDGSTTIEDIDLNSLARIEILKGPSSALYGSGLGGVIQLKSRMATENGFHTELSAGSASFSTRKFSLATSYKKDESNFAAGFSHINSEGFRQNSQYKRSQVYINNRVSRGKHSLHILLLATQVYAEIPSSLSEDNFKESPELAASNWLAVEGHENYSKLITGGSWRWKHGEHWENRFTIYSGMLDPYESRPFNILDESSVRLGAREVISYSGKSLDFESGIEVFREKYNWEIFETIAGEQGGLELENQENRAQQNYFSHLRWQLSERVNMEAGLNLNILSYSLESIYRQDGDDPSGSYSYEPVLSPRVGMNYKFAEAQHLHLSAGHGFSPPSVEETLLPEGEINPDLKAESGWNFDFGLRGWLFEKAWYYDLSIYSIFVKNMLVTKRVTEEIFTGINAGSARLQGIEFYNRIKLNGITSPGNWNSTLHLSFFINKNHFTDFVDDGNDYSMNQLPGIPVLITRTSLQAIYREKIEFRAEASFQGKQYMNDANTEVYPGHFLANLSASHHASFLDSKLRVSTRLGIDNIFNINYASMILVNAPSFGGPPRYYYPGTPRSINLGVRVIF